MQLASHDYLDSLDKVLNINTVQIMLTNLKKPPFFNDK
jgi:hypothetical protein